MTKKIFTLLTALVLSIGIGWAGSWSWTWDEFLPAGSDYIGYISGNSNYVFYAYEFDRDASSDPAIVWAVCFEKDKAGSYKDFLWPKPGTYTLSYTQGVNKSARYDANKVNWKFSGSVYSSSIYNASGTRYRLYSGDIYVEEGADGPYIYANSLELANSAFTSLYSGTSDFSIGSPATYRTVSVVSNNTTMGTVSYTYKSGYVYANNRSQEFKEGSVYTLTATPKPGYHFVSWSDGGDQEHDVTITGNKTYTATFEPDEGGDITVNYEGEGTVGGAGSYSGGAQVNLTATPADGYMFVMWKKDGVATTLTQNATVTCSGDATYTAVFKRKYQITATSADDTKGTVSISPAPVNGYCYEGQQITLTATPANSLCNFVKWQKNGADIQGGASLNVTVNANDTYTAFFEGIEATEIDIQAAMNKNHGLGWGYCFYYWAKTYGYDIQVIAIDNWEWAAGGKVTISEINTSKSYINDHGTKVTFTDFTGDCYTENGKNVLEALVKGNNGKAYLLKLRGKTADDDDTAEDYNQTYSSLNKKLEHKGNNIWQASSQNGTGADYSTTWCNHFFFKVDPTKTGDIPSGIYQLDDSQAIGTLISTSGSDYQFYGSYHVQSYLYYVPASGYAEVINTNGTYYIKFEGYSSRGYNYTVTVGTKPITSHKVTFKNGTTVLQEGQVEEGQTPAYTGETPTKESTVSTVYTFSGWNDGATDYAKDATLPAVGSNDVTYTATFSETSREYAITFVNYDGTVLQKTNVAYDATPSYDGTPSKAEDAEYTYNFAGWNPAITKVSGEATYTATYTPVRKPVTVTVAATPHGTITVMDDSQETLYTGREGGTIDNVEIGTSLFLNYTLDDGYIFVDWDITGEYEWTEHEIDAPRRAVQLGGMGMGDDISEGSSGEEITVLGALTISMTVDEKGYTLTVESNNDTWGTATITSEQKAKYAEGEQVTIEATKNAGYHFVQWNDGETANPRTITMNADKEFTAEFAGNFHLVDTEVAGATWYSNTYEPMVGKKTSVTIDRTFSAGWSIFSLPFDYSYVSKKNNTFRGMVYSLDEATYYNDGYLEFQFMPVSKIVANRPYILYTKTAIENPDFDNVTLKAIADGSYNETLSGEVVGTIDFINTQSKVTLAENAPDKSIIYISNNTLYYPSPRSGQKVTMRAFRGYFHLNCDIKHAPIRFYIEDEDVTMEMQADGGEDTNTTIETKKYFDENGNLIIERNGVKYDAQGKQL